MAGGRSSCLGSAAKADSDDHITIAPGASSCAVISNTGIAIGMIAFAVAWADPLATGKPAGVHAAQMTGTAWIGDLGGIVPPARQRRRHRHLRQPQQPNEASCIIVAADQVPYRDLSRCAYFAVEKRNSVTW